MGAVGICLFFGFYFALGLLYFSEKIQKILRLLCQLAFVLPSVFTILICFQILKPFPYGHAGIIFIFSIVHLGFSTVFIANALQYRLKNLSLISKVYNLSRVTFFRRIVGPLIYKDLAILGLIIFLSCISSLAIPIVAGGGGATNLEMYIYEKIFIEQRWNEAIVLSLIQGGVLFFITWAIFKKNIFVKNLKNSFYAQSLSSGLSAIVFVCFIGIYLLTYVSKVLTVLIRSDLSVVFDGELVSAYLNSLFLFCGLLFLFLMFMLVIFYSTYKNKYSRGVSLFVNIFLSPSTVLIGFGLYLLAPANQVTFDFVKMSLGLFILFAVGLCQTYLSAQISEIRSQLIVCRIYKINFSVILYKMIWPQMKKNIVFVISLLFLLSLSEFSLIKATGSQLQTVGTLTQLYLNSYRMDYAYVISFISLLSWFIFYGFFYFVTETVYVRNSKP